MDQLADYSSSEEEDPTTPRSIKRSPSPNQGAPDRKKRKLPALSTNLISPGPIDDPSKHQGRVRSHPHVEGQFASYIYIPINIGIDGVKEISKIVTKALRLVTKSEPLIHPIIEDFGKNIKEDSKCTLHISLSRPVYVFHHQRETLKQAVKSLASSQSSFTASFANFTAFENDEKTRAFIAMEIGAGHSEFRQLVDSMTPTLRSLYQKEYYSQPRFHASVAWALLKSQFRTNSVTTPSISPDVEVALKDNADCPSLPKIPSELITSLNNVLGKQLNRITFDVGEVEVRIGKQITTYPLRLA